MKDRILTKIVGIQHYQGVVEVGETVQVVKDVFSEYPQVLTVLNGTGEKVGNIASKLNNFDLVVNQVVNNFELYDHVEDYDFTVKRVSKYYVMLVGTLKEENEDAVSVEELESLVQNYKESIDLMVCALDELDSDDVLTSRHIRSQLDSIIKLHNEMSNKLIEVQNAASKGSIVFDYYSKEAAK